MILHERKLHKNGQERGEKFEGENFLEFQSKHYGGAVAMLSSRGTARIEAAPLSEKFLRQNEKSITEPIIRLYSLNGSFLFSFFF